MLTRMSDALLQLGRFVRLVLPAALLSGCATTAGSSSWLNQLEAFTANMERVAGTASVGPSTLGYAPAGAGAMQCVLHRAEGRLNGKWRELEVAAWSMPAGAEVAVTLSERTRKLAKFSAPVYASFSGQALTLCRYPGADCTQFLGTYADWRYGAEVTVELPGALRGQLRCSANI